MLCTTECKAYAQFLDVIKCLPMTLLAFNSQLNVDIVGMDRTSYTIEDVYPMPPPSFAGRISHERSQRAISKSRCSTMKTWL